MKRQVLPLVRGGGGGVGGGKAVAVVDLATTYRAILPSLTRYATRLVDRYDADDVVQDAMLKYLAQRGEGEWERSEEDLRLRLLVMVRDTAIDRLRRARLESRVMQFISGPTATMRRWMSPRRPVEDGELRLSIQQALATLPAYVREPWILSREVGMTIEEVSELLRISPTSCRSAITKANARLRELLGAREITPRTLRGRDHE